MLRVRPFSIVILLLMLSLFGSAYAQQWSGLLAPNRAVDWSQAGAGSIPARTTVCASLTSSASPSAVASALASCPAGQTVSLAAGTYNWSSSLVTQASNVTLRGAGPTQTILKFTGTSSNCNGLGATAICIWNGDTNGLQYSQNVLSVTGGVNQGSTSITLGGSAGSICGGSGTSAGSTSCPGSIANLHVGSLMTLNETDQGSDNGNYWACGTLSCSQQGNANAMYNRTHMQLVQVTGINGSTVTFTPGLYAADWSSNRSPIAMFSNSLPISNFGLENLQVNTQSLGNIWAQTMFWQASNSWVKNVSFINADGLGAAARKHVLIGSSSHITIRDSYLYGSSPSSEGYGVDLVYATSDSLIENNIAHHMAAPFITEGAIGNVFGYNFDVDDYYIGASGNAANWQGGDADHHNGGDTFNLWEGHQGIGFQSDDIHGTSFANTLFRSRINGRDTANTCPPSNPSCGTQAKNQNTQAVLENAFERYDNLVANVLGTAGYHTVYQITTCPGGTWNSVFILNCASGSEGNDPLVATTLMRWGNYDTVNAAVRTSSGESGSGAPTYPGLSSPSTSWSNYSSLYLSNQPSWWGSMPWPAVGPDVTGGDISSVGGHAYNNPAASCFLNVLGGKLDGSSGVLNFDANACYPTSASSSGGPPPPPSNLTGTVQ